MPNTFEEAAVYAKNKVLRELEDKGGGVGGAAPVVIDLPLDKDTLFSGANIPVDDQMVETLEKAAINHSTVYVQITGGSTMVLPFNLAVVQSGQDYKYYTFCCVSVDMSTVSYSGFMINLHTGDKTINGKATAIKGVFE